MQQHPRALDVTKKPVADTGPLMSTFNQARNIRNNKFTLINARLNGKSSVCVGVIYENFCILLVLFVLTGQKSLLDLALFIRLSLDLILFDD